MAERKLTIRMEAETAHLRKGMTTASASTKSFGRSIQQGITRHAAGIRATGMAIAGLGAAMTGMAVISIKAAVDFEKQLANVSTMLDDISMEFMPSFAKGLREMSKQFGQSTETLSKGLYDILSASIPPAKALDVLAVSAMAAVAGLTETGITADAITTILNSYGFAAEDAGMVSDKLWAIIKKGKTTMVELAPSIGKVASIAATAGLSFDELGATLATLTRGGIKTDEAMTGVRAIMLAFLKPTDDAAEAAKEFGLELSSNILKTKGLRGVIELLNEASAEQLAKILPNVRGLAAMATALGDVEGWTESYKMMLDSAGLTEEMFRKQTEATAFTFAQLKQEFIDITRRIGDEFLPIIKNDFLPLVLKVVDYLKGWIERFKELSPPIKKFLLILGPVLIALGGLIALLPTLIPMLPLLGAAFHLALGPIGLITGAIALATTAILLFREASKTSELEAMANAYSDLTDILKEKKGSIDNLIKIIEDLRSKTELTKEETYNLKAAEEALGIYFPTLGDAAEDAAGKIDILTVAKKESLELTKEIMEMELSLAETEKSLAEIELARFERNEDESAKEKKRIEKRLKFMRKNAEALINLSIQDARFTSATIDLMVEAYRESGLIIKDFKKKLHEISEDRKKGLNVEIKLENLKQEVVEKALNQNREYIKTQEDLTIVTLESARTHITLENNLASATLKVKGLQGSLESLGDTVEDMPVELPLIKTTEEAVEQLREGIVGMHQKIGDIIKATAKRWVDYHRTIARLGEKEETAFTKHMDAMRRAVIKMAGTYKATIIELSTANARIWVDYHRTIARLGEKEETAFTKHMDAMRRAVIKMAGHAEKIIIKLTMGNAKRWVEYHRTIATLSKKEETGFTKHMDAMRKAHISMTESVEKGAIQLIAGTGKRWVAYHRAIGKLAKESYATYHESLEREERERIALLDSLTKEEKEYYREIKGYLGDYTDMTKSELEEVKNAWGKAGEDINTGWTAFMISMRDTTINWVEEFKRLSGEITEVFKSSISSWIQGGQTFGEFWSSLTQKLADTWLNNFIDNLMKTEPIKMVLDSVTWLMGNLTKAIMGAASAAWEFAGPAIMKLISGLGSLIGKLWDAVAATMKFVYATLKAIAVAVYNAVAWIPFIGPVLGIIAAAAAIAAILALVGSIIFPAQKGLYAKEPMTVQVAERGVPEIISPEPIMRKIVREESQVGLDGARYPAGIIVNVPRGAIVIYGDIRTKMDVEELEETLGQKFGEEIARRVEEV